MGKGGAVVVGTLACVAMTSACHTGSGNAWMEEPLVPEEERQDTSPFPQRSSQFDAQKLGTPPNSGDKPQTQMERPPLADVGGRSLGVFRNTYYDFPNEADFSGDRVKLMNASCGEIANVPRAFHDAVCVQGSGHLARGQTVSFAKRDCACAETCPRTGQKICFDALDSTRFPWGRGAAGTAIRPLVSVAADPHELPLGTPIYIAELDGIVPADGEAPLDGCFVVEDRGVRVEGQHVDIFTGTTTTTASLNSRVPSNTGVTVKVDVARCERLREK